MVVAPIRKVRNPVTIRVPAPPHRQFQRHAFRLTYGMPVQPQVFGPYPVLLAHNPIDRSIWRAFPRLVTWYNALGYSILGGLGMFRIYHHSDPLSTLK